MSAHNDVGQLQRRLNSLVRTAGRIGTHMDDLYLLGWEKPVTDVENVASGKPESKPPGGGDPRARRLFERIFAEVAQMEAEFVGLERQMVGLFYAGSSNPEPSRGSMISREEFDRQLGRQRARGDAPARLVDQPEHPGRRR